jgi:4a-hydroxytetrahydrobiopterin dehydratase
VEKLSFADILPQLPAWSEFEGREAIYREYIFADFQEAFAFMTSVALKAEVINHHPEWYNSYNLLTVALTTHEINGLSELDVELAQYMDSTYEANLAKKL